MKSVRGNSSAALQEDDDEYDDDFGSKKEATSNTNKEGKSSDKANAVRSKHSVTEQRRRSKINERFQILRDLIPHGDQKRDTASFLLEVIDYVQVLQEKVQKYEGSFQAWSTEPTKLMPWRHSHWRVQNLLGVPQQVKNGAGPGMPFSGKLDEKSISIDPSETANALNSTDPDSNQDAYRMLGDPHPELAAKVHTLPSPFQVHMPVPVHTDGARAHPSQGSTSDAQSIDCPLASDNQQDEHTVEGGTISISSAYSHELLTNLTQALQSSGVDLSKATISIQIDLGKRANQSLASCSSNVKDTKNVSCNLAMTHHREGSGAEELEHAQKRLKP